MRFGKFQNIEKLLARIDAGEGHLCSEAVELFNELYHDIHSERNFSVSSMVLYQEYRSKFHEMSDNPPGKRIPSFFADDFLERRFSVDPSNFAIVAGLAINKLQAGDLARAKQLFERVANSRYRECKLARNYLDKYFGAATEDDV